MVAADKFSCIASTTLIALAELVKLIDGRTPLYCALMIVLLTGMIAIWGTAGGASLLVLNSQRRMAVGVAGIGGMLVYLVSVAVAEDHPSWL